MVNFESQKIIHREATAVKATAEAPATATTTQMPSDKNLFNKIK